MNRPEDQQTKEQRAVAPIGVGRVSRFSLSSLMLMIFSLACLMAFLRMAVMNRSEMQMSSSLIPGMLGLFGFSISIGLLKRGDFLFMVAAFVFAMICFGCLRLAVVGGH